MRSAAAAETIAREQPGIDTDIVDYTSAAVMQRALADCAAVVHLVGILKETAGNRYVDAHEATCEALATAARANQLERIVYVSILGSDAASNNPCLASKGRAEDILVAGATATVVLQVPMVLGENDFASRALMARARARFAVTLRGASREQPIYAGDVIDAIVAALEPRVPPGTLRLAGPESVSRTELTRRAGRILNTSPQVVSLPVGLGLAAARLFEWISTNPPVTRAMLDVLDHDDDIDPRAASTALGIELTPLDTMLSKIGAPHDTRH
ncbi:MAG: hypothetical protein HC809_04725 [Gammaproteobacteria bacterium]|nr:hypothetical protein [Gammaproteobacteria bacterium]